MLSFSFGLKGLSEGSHFIDLSIRSNSLMDLKYSTHKYFLFYNNDDDDMEIECKCPMLNNYYIKNLKFKEGNYTLEFKNKIKN